jgi:hypothetical protein
MIAVLTVLFVVAISLIVVRVATVGLVMTGISKDLAHFQALSAFTGSGFTTYESEQIVNHPVRRRIVTHLMLLGHAGAVIAISSILLSFLNVGRSDAWTERRLFRLGILFSGILVLLVLSYSRHAENVMWKVTSWALYRWIHLDVRDYTKLLRLGHSFVVFELAIKPGDWLADRSLADAQLSREGVLVLGIERKDGHYVGAPRGNTIIHAGDCLILYGQQEALLDLDVRSADLVGNLQHVIAVTRELDRLETQDRDEQVNWEQDGDRPSEAG